MLVVTSDKVYDNHELGVAFEEDDPLGGKDPYSASKAAAEVIARAFAATYFAPRGVALVTARGGNVIGGGDYAEDRIVPDVVRAWARGAGRSCACRMRRGRGSTRSIASPAICSTSSAPTIAGSARSISAPTRSIPSPSPN